jgi:hypothetical protein
VIPWWRKGGRGITRGRQGEWQRGKEEAKGERKGTHAEAWVPMCGVWMCGVSGHRSKIRQMSTPMT